MSARDKLNAAYALGGVAVAALVGGLFRSWVVFVVTTLVLLSLAYVAGHIRPRR